jgi:hypothetical protein
MKRALVLLLLLLVAAGLFADDALVLPKGVLRTYITGAFAFATSAWDENADTQDLAATDASYRVVNLGAAVEFGVTDWLSAAVQWAPGWNVWSDLYQQTTAPMDKATVNGPYDIFAGAKIQIIGEKAPVAMEKIRLAVAPGVKIPLPAPDWQKQTDKATAGDPWILMTPDKHTLGVGARAYFDFVVNSMIYLNLYSEFIYFPMAVKLDTVSWPDWFAVQLGAPNSDVAYGYDLTLEAEPHFEIMIMEGTRLGIGVPVTFTMTPELKVDDVAVPDSDSHLLTVTPNVSLFLMNSPIPLEFKIGYTLPLLGKNADATNILVLQVKTYLKFSK